MIAWLAPLMLAGSSATVEHPSRDVPCQAIDGWDSLLARDQVRWIVIGEMHGNAESPTIFADAVCLTAQARPVVVALEMPSIAQANIDAFMASDGGEDAEAAFLADPIWHYEFKDGRSSQAMFRLFQRLRAMHAAGQIERVVAAMAIDPAGPPSRARHEELMAGALAAAGEGGATVLMLVGNAHARLQPLDFGGEVYPPMASLLPGSQTITLNIENNGGETWACSGRPIVCGSITNGRAQVLSDRREVRLGGQADESYSGQLFLGTATTASPPQ